MTPAIRLRAYADRLERFRDRASFRASEKPGMPHSDPGADRKLSWYVQMIDDLRACADAWENGGRA